MCMASGWIESDDDDDGCCCCYFCCCYYWDHHTEYESFSHLVSIARCGFIHSGLECKCVGKWLCTLFDFGIALGTCIHMDKHNEYVCASRYFHAHVCVVCCYCVRTLIKNAYLWRIEGCFDLISRTTTDGFVMSAFYTSHFTPNFKAYRTSSPPLPPTQTHTLTNTGNQLPLLFHFHIDSSTFGAFPRLNVSKLGSCCPYFSLLLLFLLLFFYFCFSPLLIFTYVFPFGKKLP